MSEGNFNTDNNQSEPVPSETVVERIINETLLEVPERRFDLKKELLDWVFAIVIAVACAFVLRTFVFTLVKVDGESMVPTLQNAERLVVWRLFYKPNQGDIIIFKPRNGSKAPYVKRIIALEGQKVFIDNSTHRVYVDDVLLDEPYINNATSSRTQEFEIPPGHAFVMGDNRGVSRDSRSSDVSYVTYESIMGKAVVRLWPLPKVGLLSQ